VRMEYSESEDLDEDDMAEKSLIPSRRDTVVSSLQKNTTISN